MTDSTMTIAEAIDRAKAYVNFIDSPDEEMRKFSEAVSLLAGLAEDYLHEAEEERFSV